MPAPESRTSKIACASRLAVLTAIRPPLGVNLIAFEIRLSITCARRSRIAFEAARRSVAQRQLDLLRVRGRPRRRDALRSELSEIDLAHVERQRSVARLRDEQEVADETHEPLGVPLHDLEERLLLRCPVRPTRRRRSARDSPGSR